MNYLEAFDEQSPIVIESTAPYQVVKWEIQGQGIGTMDLVFAITMEGALSPHSAINPPQSPFKKGGGKEVLRLRKGEEARSL